LEGLNKAGVVKTKALYLALLRSTGRARRPELVLKVFGKQRFPLMPLQNGLLAPELQRQSRGKRRI
jgi:hypothetical protein